VVVMAWPRLCSTVSMRQCIIRRVSGSRHQIAHTRAYRSKGTLPKIANSQKRIKMCISQSIENKRNILMQSKFGYS
jgi:hypothetical protein